MPYELMEIPIDRIDTPVQVREVDSVHVQRLADAITAGDVLPPIEVFKKCDGQVDWNSDNRNEFTSCILGPGRHRLEAHKAAGLDHIRAFVRPTATMEQVERAQLLENLNRHDMLPIEEAFNVARLLHQTRNPDYLRTHPDAVDDAVGHIAAMLGRSKSWVNDRMYIDRLCKPVQALAQIGQIPAGHLRELAKLGDEQAQWRLACDIAHLMPHVMKPDFKTGAIEWPNEDAWGTSEAAFRRQIAEGSIRRMTVEDVRDLVESQQRELKIVPWNLSLPMAVSRTTTLPACIGCEHNSETDGMLFAVEGDQVHGVCHNAACFEQKKAAAQDAKAKLVKAFSRRKKAPGSSEIDDKTPGWLKQSTARGVVQRDFKKRQAVPDQPADSVRAANGQAVAPNSPEAKHAEAMQAWQGSAFDVFQQFIIASPWRMAMVLVLGDTDHAMCGSDHTPLLPWLKGLAEDDPAKRAAMTTELIEWFGKHQPPGGSFATDILGDMVDDEQLAEVVQALGLLTTPMPTLEEFQEEKPTADGRQPKAKGSKRKPAKKKTGKKA